MEEIRVAVNASDPVSRAGLEACLRSLPEVQVLPDAERDAADILIVVCRTLTPDVRSVLRLFAAEVGSPVVLVCDGLGGERAQDLPEHNVVSVIPRRSVTAELIRDHVLIAAVGAASGSGDRAPAIVVRRVSLGEAELSAREIEVLRLLAEGFSTQEIAERLGYSDRTVKKDVHAINRRLGVRNRAHAVAYALRAGLV